jgi:RHS repeat-associated protein
VDTALWSNSATLNSVVISGNLSGSGGSGSSVHWLVPDQLGTPRLVLDQTGSLATVTRHDYLPFGEEVFALGLRVPALGYSVISGVRQQFTQKERDIETGLDYSTRRYYSPTQGRFTSPDVPFADQWEADPQSWNLYTYVGNNPTNATDPFGLWKNVDCDNGGQCWQAEDGDTWESFSAATGYSKQGLKRFFVGETITSGQVFDVGGFKAWTESFDNKFVGLTMLRRPPEFELAIGGGLRNVSKAAPAATGLLSRLGRWLGFGKKAAPAAQEGVVALRQAYEVEVKALASKAAQLKASGRSVEQIAIELHAERRALGVKYKDITPPEILQKILERNLSKYGDELGPSIDWLRKQGRSWEDIIEGASRPGGGDLKP